MKIGQRFQGSRAVDNHRLKSRRRTRFSTFENQPQALFCECANGGAISLSQLTRSKQHIIRDFDGRLHMGNHIIQYGWIPVGTQQYGLPPHIPVTHSHVRSGNSKNTRPCRSDREIRSVAYSPASTNSTQLARTASLSDAFTSNALSHAGGTRRRRSA